MTSTYTLTRDVTQDECPWLANVAVPMTARLTVYRCVKPTFGAVKDFPATLDSTGDYPFFELPFDAIVRTDTLEEVVF